MLGRRGRNECGARALTGVSKEFAKISADVLTSEYRKIWAGSEEENLRPMAKEMPMVEPFLGMPYVMASGALRRAAVNTCARSTSFPWRPKGHHSLITPTAQTGFLSE